MRGSDWLDRFATSTFKILTILLCVAYSAQPSYAQYAEQQPALSSTLSAEENAPPSTPVQRGLLDGTFSLIGTTFEVMKHDLLSTSFENLSRRIDSFFGDERAYEEYNRSYASLRLSTDYKRGGETNPEAKVRMRLSLPNTKNRLHLLIESEEDDSNPDLTSLDSSSDNTTGNNDINASLQYIIREKHHWKIDASPGLKTSGFPLVPFFKLHFRRNGTLFNWASKLEQTFEWFYSTGYGTKTAYYIERPLSKKTLFRFTTQAYRNENEYIHGNYTLTQQLYLFYAYNKRVGLSTSFSFNSQIKPNWQHVSYTYNVLLRKNIHKGFVFLDLKPQIDFNRTTDFHGEASIFVQLEVLYGIRYTENGSDN